MSNKSDVYKILDFLRIARKMQTTYRFNPKPNGGFENDAEHSWSVALICMLITRRVEKELGIKIDQGKMLKMAIIHDMAEIKTGDTKTWDEKARIDKEKKEREAMRSITSYLPVDLRKEMLLLWEECEARKSIEAMIVKSIDRLDPVVHRTVFGVGWENVEKEFTSAESLNGRQLPRHEFSKVLTNLYIAIRDEALEKGMIK